METTKINTHDLSPKNPCRGCEDSCGQAGLVKGYLKVYDEFPNDLRVCSKEYRV